MEIAEGVVERSVSLDPPFVLSFDAAEREGVECVRRALEQLGSKIVSGTEPVFEVDHEGEDVVGGGQRDEGAESEDFTIADALRRSSLLSETILGGHASSSKLPLC